MMDSTANMMTRDAEYYDCISPADKQEEKKESKTAWLRNWLDTEIEKCAADILIVHGVKYTEDRKLLLQYDFHRYVGLTSEELAVKIEDDKRKLARFERHMPLLRSAKDLDVDIDRIEKMFRAELHTYVSSGAPEVKFEFSLSSGNESMISFWIFLGERRIDLRTTGAPFTNHVTMHGLEKVQYYGSTLILCFEGETVRLSPSFLRIERRNNK